MIYFKIKLNIKHALIINSYKTLFNKRKNKMIKDQKEQKRNRNILKKENCKVIIVLFYHITNSHKYITRKIKNIISNRINTFLFCILHEFSYENIKRVSDIIENNILITIFDLFLSKPKYKIIIFNILKYICKEIGKQIIEDKLKYILKNTLEKK